VKNLTFASRLVKFSWRTMASLPTRFTGRGTEPLNHRAVQRDAEMSN